MSWRSQAWTEIRVRALSLLRRNDLRDRVDAEMRLHLELRVERLIEGGLGPDQARARARAEFGNPVAIREAALDNWRYAPMDTVLQDVRYGLRLLRRNPIFALTAALSLAIGIGANTTVFSVVNRLLLRDAVGVADPGRLVDISPTSGTGMPVEPVLPFRAYDEIRRRTTTLEALFGYQLEPAPLSMGASGGAERVFGTYVTGDYFTTLGVRPAIGRVFDQAEVDRSDGGLVVLSHAFWLRDLGGNAAIVGQVLRLSGRPHTVVGVAAEGFQGTSVVVADLYLPIPKPALTSVRFAVGARLKAGVSVGQAAAEVGAIGQALSRDLPAPPPAGGLAVREQGRAGLAVSAASPIPPVLRLPIAAFLALLMGIVSVVLAIACANIAGVLLARAAARRQEIAVRLALGAGRLRLVRQLLTETLLVFALGGAAGILLARVMTAALVGALPSLPVPIDVALPIDARVLLFTAGLSLVAATVCGLVPALQASRADVVSALKNDAQGPSDRLRLRNAFVIAQVAFSILLIVGAGLFVRALKRSASVELGFDPRGVEVATLNLALGNYSQDAGRLFLRDLENRLRRLPGVQDAAIAMAPPMGAARQVIGDLRAPGEAPSAPVPPPRDLPSSNSVSPGYFATLRIPLVAGRDFTDADRDGSPPVAVVSEAAARKFWPGQSAVGQYLPWRDLAARGASSNLLVVGVARDLKTTGRHSDGPIVYLPLQQRHQSAVTLLVRTAGGQRVAGEIRQLIASMDNNLPIVSSRTLEDESSPALTQLRVSASVCGAVGIVGLVLAGIGIYGVTAYAVARRTREIGIRIALGAHRGDVMRMVLTQGMRLVAIGGAIGLVTAAAGSRLLVRLLFGVPPLDPVVFFGSAALFAAIGMAACYIPARRATRIDAMQALRSE